ncbi:MAG: acyl-CoA dehydrogenase family protein [Anaerolineales bacterium]
MIDFELSANLQQQVDMVAAMAKQIMRPIAREYDERESEPAWEYINPMWEVTKLRAQADLERSLRKAAQKDADANGDKPKKPRTGNIAFVHIVEMMSWGDVGLYLTTPSSGLGGAAIEAVGTPAQKERFLRRFTEGQPKWGAMAITESHAGSDTANIKTSARLDPDTNEWVLNGEKIFITSGKMAGTQPDGLVVVWATIDPAAGRAGIKPFVVEAGTPGFTVAHTEKKLGIRASDTAALVFRNCRIPYDNILGSPEVATGKGRKGFKGVMKTFDNTRPIVAASAMGVGRAALEFTLAELAANGVQPRFDAPPHEWTAVERDLIEMKAQHKAAWLLTQRAAWMADQRLHNPIEASMCKAKAGTAVTRITQKAVELLGPLGYSRELLVEKWMRDAKINDIYEGTYQINLLIIARRMLGYSREQLK